MKEPLRCVILELAIRQKCCQNIVNKHTSLHKKNLNSDVKLQKERCLNGLNYQIEKAKNFASWDSDIPLDSLSKDILDNGSRFGLHAKNPQIIGAPNEDVHV